MIFKDAIIDKIIIDDDKDKVEFIGCRIDTIIFNKENKKTELESNNE